MGISIGRFVLLLQTVISAGAGHRLVILGSAGARGKENAHGALDRPAGTE